MELWPMVLEKAYAKLHHNWDAIDGGFSGHAVKDMTGGVMQMLDLHGDDKGRVRCLSKNRWAWGVRRREQTPPVLKEVVCCEENQGLLWKGPVHVC